MVDMDMMDMDMVDMDMVDMDISSKDWDQRDRVLTAYCHFCYMNKGYVETIPCFYCSRCISTSINF